MDDIPPSPPFRDTSLSIEQPVTDFVIMCLGLSPALEG